MGARPVSEGAKGIVWAAKLPSGGFFRRWQAPALVAAHNDKDPIYRARITRRLGLSDDLRPVGRLADDR